MKDRVFNEVKIVHSLKHPNVLRFHNWYETRNHYWIIYEYCSGGDLRVVVDKDKQVPSAEQIIESVLRSFARDLVSALSYLHSEGVIFCDLKPGNILLNEFSNLKLCDFGLSQKVVDMVEGEEKKQKEDVLGTPYYMAPELFDPQGVFSFASDIYALGVVLYELACGKTPFTEESFPELARKICESSPKPLTNVSSECNNFILSLLEKNPVKRPKWDKIVTHVWWGGIKFQTYEFPEETHFEKYSKLRGLDLPPNEAEDSHEDEGLEKSKLNASRISHQTEQIMRMSQNIKKNFNRETGEFLDTREETSGLKLDKNMTVNMGTKTTVVAEVTDEFSKSQDTAQDESKSRISNKEDINKSLTAYESHIKRDLDLAEPELNPLTEHLYAILVVPSDRTAKPIMANPEIEQLEDFEYSTSVEGFELIPMKDIVALEKPQLDAYLSQVYQITAANSSTKDKTNILNYFVSNIQSSDVANIIVESYFMNLFVKLLKTVKVKNFKVPSLDQVVICTIIALCIRHTTVDSDIPKLELVPILLELLKDSSVSVRRRAMASLGEYLFYGSEKVKDSDDSKIWEISQQTLASLLQALKNPHEDDIVKHYSIKTIENITCQSKAGDSGEKFCTDEFVVAILNLCLHSQQQAIRSSALISLSSICILAPKYLPTVLKTLGVTALAAQVTDSEKKTQQAIMNLLCMSMLFGDAKEMMRHIKTLQPLFTSFFEQGSAVLKAKTLLLFLILYTQEPALLMQQTQAKILQMLDKLSLDKSKNIKTVIKEFLGFLEAQFERGLDMAEREADGLDRSPKEEDFDTDNQTAGFDGLQRALLLISSSITSIHSQEVILGEERLIRIFRFMRFYDSLSSKHIKSTEVDIIDTVNFICEQVISNKKVVGKYQLIFASEILPPLCQSLDAKGDESRFAAIKWISDIILQISSEEVVPETKEFVRELAKRLILPRAKPLLVDSKNLTSTGILRLLRTLLDFSPDLSEDFFSTDIHKAVLECFESSPASPVNNERCNANTIRVISHLVGHPLLKLKVLLDFGFLDKYTALFQNISDVTQGDEIIELGNTYFQRVLKEAKIVMGPIESLKKHKRDVQSFLGEKQEKVFRIHQKCIELMQDAQAVAVP